MFYKKTLNNRINRIYEKTLSIMYRDKKSNFIDLMQIDNTGTVYQRNLRTLATTFYKVKIGVSPNLIKKPFPLSTCALA